MVIVSHSLITTMVTYLHLSDATRIITQESVIFYPMTDRIQTKFPKCSFHCESSNFWRYKERKRQRQVAPSTTETFFPFHLPPTLVTATFFNMYPMQMYENFPQFNLKLPLAAVPAFAFVLPR